MRAAKDFESVLLGKLVDEMKNTIPEGGLFDTGISKQIGDLFWHYLAKDLGEKGGLGLWKEIYKQMAASQASNPGKDGQAGQTGRTGRTMEQAL